jgi:hypothetical protein
VCLTDAHPAVRHTATPDAGGPSVTPVAVPWDDGTPGLLRLPSGRRVRGRAWREVPGGQRPDLGLYLLPRPPAAMPWESRWVRWRDFSLPADPAQLREALVEVLSRSADERVEVSCPGGTGRTGTALACLAVLDGVPAADAVAFVRAGYRPRAVETRGQQAFVRDFSPG